MGTVDLPRFALFDGPREQMLEYTAKNPFGRFADGRPKVPDELLEKVKGLSAEEVWAVLPGKHFPNQYEGNWRILHPERKLIGRAVTAQFMPIRPDVAEVSEAKAVAKGSSKFSNERVIDMLQTGDVLVADIFGKVDGGPIIGDNLATAIYAATKTGAVFDGAIRDLEGIMPIPFSLYVRAVHPTPMGDIMLTGVNIPVRIGSATVMPGDLVFGDSEGIYFIPPQFVQEIVDKADITHIHDEWTKAKFLTGKYKASDLYPTPTIPELKKEYQEYLKKKLGK